MGDTFVVNVSGRFALTGGSRIVADGVPASAVLYNVIGAGPQVALTGKARIDRTLLALERDIAVTHAVVDGEVVGGRDISLIGGASVECPEDPQGDCEVANTALHVLNASTAAVTPLCAAGAVSVANGNAAFLRPEAAGSGPGCPPEPDPNRDGDTRDQVVHLSRAGGAAENLGCAGAVRPLRVAGRVELCAAHRDVERLAALQREDAGEPKSRRSVWSISCSMRGARRRCAGTRKTPCPPTTSMVTPWGSKLLLLNQEVRFPLFSRWLQGAAFIDAGNTFKPVTSIRLDQLAVGAGFGIRIMTPFAPIRLDVGYPVNRRPDDKPYGFYFSIGQIF